jgi:hypothetical protein
MTGVAKLDISLLDYPANPGFRGPGPDALNNDL